MYPGIAKDPNEEVEGVLYFDINDQDLKTLDEFEFEYNRDTVEIVGGDGKMYEAGTYVIKNVERMSEKHWEPEHFVKHHMHTFAQVHTETIPK